MKRPGGNDFHPIPVGLTTFFPRNSFMQSLGYFLQVPVASRFTSGLLTFLLFWPMMSIGLAEEPVSPPATPTDMQLLFDGKTLEGWDGDPRLWSVRDGVIHGETTPEAVAQGNTFLIWQGGPIKDFDLRLSFRCNATNNSGIQYRSRHITDGSVKNQWVVRGYQHEVRNEQKLPNVAGFIYDEGGARGRLCLVGERVVWREGKKKEVLANWMDESAYRKLFRLDDWNDVVIIAKGNRIQHFLNGQLIVDFTDDDPQLQLLEGVLALQLHAGSPMWAEFRDVRLKKLQP
jgi:hypothetical protein